MDKPLNDATHPLNAQATQDLPAPRAVPFDPSILSPMMPAQICDTRDAIQELERLLLLQQEPLAILKLAAYAADAMRVLTALGRHSDISPTLADALKGICPDWRNPGALDDPADLIAVALYGALNGLQKTMAEFERVMKAMQSDAQL